MRLEVIVHGSLNEIYKSVTSVFKYFIYLLFSFLLIASCTTKQETITIHEPVKDTITVLCDPSWESILNTFIVTYEGLNPNRKVRLLIKPEAECIADLINNRYNTIFVSRDFTEKERNLLKQKQWRVNNDTLCFDGLTWIAPKSFPQDSLSIDEIKKLFETGKFQHTQYTIQLNSSSSSVANYLTDYFGMPASTSHIYSGGSDEQIIQSVQEHNNALACISSGWLVNLENKKHKAYLESIKIVRVINDQSHVAYSPFQNDLALGTYPFKRVLRVLNNDANTGLGTAFASFLIGNRGQRLFLKAGLLPFKMPAREIEFKQNK